MKKIILGLMLVTTLSTAGYAATTASSTAATTTPTAGAYTPGKTSKVDFESLSKAEKIKLIEQKHAEAKARYDAKWKSMNDDDKIAQYEKRRQRFMARKDGAAGSSTAPTGATTSAPMAAQAAPAAIPAPAATTK